MFMILWINLRYKVKIGILKINCWVIKKSVDIRIKILKK